MYLLNKHILTQQTLTYTTKIHLHNRHSFTHIKPTYIFSKNAHKYIANTRNTIRIHTNIFKILGLSYISTFRVVHSPMGFPRGPRRGPWGPMGPPGHPEGGPMGPWGPWALGIKQVTPCLLFPAYESRAKSTPPYT